MYNTCRSKTINPQKRSDQAKERDHMVVRQFPTKRACLYGLISFTKPRRRALALNGKTATAGRTSPTPQSVERYRTSWHKESSVSQRMTLLSHTTANAFLGQKAKEAKEEADRQEENRRKAGAAYVAPDPNALAPEGDLSGLPWGGVSFKHIMETGKTKEQQSQQSSRESSVYAAASRTGGSSR